jgi:lipopolysaccharide/colanic/teichoic acid biosynthesis glycosyltransferase
VKRTFDFVTAALALALLLPLLVVIAVAVRLDSAGPAIFRQTRVGRGGREFQILKFRSMVTVLSSNAPAITVAGDARITRVGGFIRRTKLDELPQLWNVLRGEMSLVGPRPEVPQYVALYPEDARREVLSVRPGITDSAAIVYRNENELLAASADPQLTYVQTILPHKLSLYRQYVRTRTFLGDLSILWRTAASLILRR